MPEQGETGRRVIKAWRTNHKATTYLVEHLPPAIWPLGVPGIPRHTVGMIAAHLHNSRCLWIESIGARHGITAPPLVKLRQVTPRALVRALREQRRHHRADRAGHRQRRRGSTGPMAELPHRPRALPQLLRRPRGASSRTTDAARTSTGPSPAAGRRWRRVAVDPFRARLSGRRQISRKAELQFGRIGHRWRN